MPGHSRGLRRSVASFAALATSYAAATAAGWPAAAVPADTTDTPTPCWSDQIAVTAAPAQGAVGHRAVTLVFTLAGGALVHAQPTPRGYLGGLPAGVDAPPTVILSISTHGQAIVEGVAVDADGQPCPTYTDLLVNPPDTTAVVTVPATIEACELQVHPITAV